MLERGLKLGAILGDKRGAPLDAAVKEDVPEEVTLSLGPQNDTREPAIDRATFQEEETARQSSTSC